MEAAATSTYTAAIATREPAAHRGELCWIDEGGARVRLLASGARGTTRRVSQHPAGAAIDPAISLGTPA